MLIAHAFVVSKTGFYCNTNVHKDRLTIYNLLGALRLHICVAYDFFHLFISIDYCFPGRPNRGLSDDAKATANYCLLKRILNLSPLV